MSSRDAPPHVPALASRMAGVLAPWPDGGEPTPEHHDPVDDPAGGPPRCGWCWVVWPCGLALLRPRRG